MSASTGAVERMADVKARNGALDAKHPAKLSGKVAEVIGGNERLYSMWVEKITTTPWPRPTRKTVKRGRPRKHDHLAVMRAVCARIATGELVKDAAKAEGVTPKSVREWAEDAELGALYARAREDQAHALAEECIAIADGTDAEAEARLDAMVQSVEHADDDDKERLLAGLATAAIQRDRLRLDARKWLTSKIAPRHYGERLTAELTGADGAPLPAPQPPQVFLIGGQKVEF